MKKETLQITGKVKTEEKDKSLKGLKVMAYAAGTKVKLGEAITDADGSYKILFEFDKPVDVEIQVCPDVNENVLAIMPKVRQFVSKEAWVKRSPLEMQVKEVYLDKAIWIKWETICKTYLIHGLVVKGIPDPDNPGSYLDYIPIPDVTVHIYDVSPSLLIPLGWPPPFPLLKSKIGTATTDANGLFMFEFDWCYKVPAFGLWGLLQDPKPDIVFQVTQTVNGVEVPIYQEDPKTETRWNVEALPPLGVTLVVEGDVVLPDDPVDPISGDFEFHGIGRVLISQINAEGYADTSGTGDVVRAKDSPFGSSIDIKGQFNNSLQGKYYQLSYAKWATDATAPSEGDFTPILDEAWPVAQKIDGNWVTVIKSPVELPGAGGGCYQIPDYTDLYLTSKDLLIRWTTHRKDLGAPRYPDGKYGLMVKAFNADGSPVPLPAGGDIKLIVRVDNTWPVAEIKEDLTIIGGTVPICPDPKPAGMICDNPEVCGIVYVEPGKQVRLKFDAYDQQNHFRSYRLTYRFGHGDVANVPGGSKYFAGPPREDYGFVNQTTDWGIAGLKQCGYEIRLSVWDRTINGYTHIHRSEDFIHLILLEMLSP